MTTKVILAAAAFAFTATAGFASTVFENEYQAGNSGNETTQWVQSSTFTLGADTAITGGTVAIAGFGDLSAWDGAFEYYIFSDLSDTPDSVLASGDATVGAATDSGVAWSSGGNIFDVEFDLAAAFNALAGTTYWLGIHLSTDFARDQIYWVQSDTQEFTSQSNGGTLDNWVTYSPARAFTLEGEPVATVPLPASLPLLLAGFGALGIARRKRKAA